MSEYEKSLLTTLCLYANTLGTRRVVELCQFFILDTAFPVQKEDTPALTPTPTPEPIEEPVQPPPPAPIKTVATIKRKTKVAKVKVPDSTPEAQEQLQTSVAPPPPPSKKKIKVRNFRKLVTDGTLPIGSVLYPSAPDPINPATAGLVVKAANGQPAIQPSWDKSKVFTGTSTPPAMFLNEAQKRFPSLKLEVKDNAWNGVLWKGEDGHYRVLSDLQ